MAQGESSRNPMAFASAFDFCLSTSIPVLTTRTYVVAWPQGDQLLGEGPWHKANLPATQLAFASVLYPGRCLASQPIHSGSEVEQGRQ